MSHWTTNYVGLPYLDGGRTKAGLDCWGLLRLVYLDLDGIELPLLPGVTNRTACQLANDITEASKDWVRLPAPEDRCAVAMGYRNHPHHVGVWTAEDGGRVIHCWAGHSVVADKLRTLKLKGFRVLDFYRYGLHR